MRYCSSSGAHFGWRLGWHSARSLSRAPRSSGHCGLHHLRSIPRGHHHSIHSHLAQPPHVQAPSRPPLRAGHVTQTRRRPHQCRLPVGESAHPARADRPFATLETAARLACLFSPLALLRRVSRPLYCKRSRPCDFLETPRERRPQPRGLSLPETSRGSPGRRSYAQRDPDAWPHDQPLCRVWHRPLEADGAVLVSQRGNLGPGRIVLHRRHRPARQLSEAFRRVRMVHPGE